jgi:hypothetical protein
VTTTTNLRARTLTFAGAAALAAAAALGAGPAHAAAPLAVSTVASWQMNEAAGATVMQDSSGHHLNGKISAQAASAGLTTGGGSYHWSTRCPACLPAAPERVVQVPDNNLLDIPDPSLTYTLEFRFKTTHPYGNYMQKGQSTTSGGQIKVQGPKGNVQCLFKGVDGQVGTGSGPGLDDGAWHTVKCVHTATSVKEYVDTVLVATKNGSTGVINNTSPFTIGGKLNCDQVKTTCDYYSGDIDYVRITTG